MKLTTSIGSTIYPSNSLNGKHEISDLAAPNKATPTHVPTLRLRPHHMREIACYGKHSAHGPPQCTICACRDERHHPLVSYSSVARSRQCRPSHRWWQGSSVISLPLLTPTASGLLHGTASGASFSSTTQHTCTHTHPHMKELP